jgi:hypothetical protein
VIKINEQFVSHKQGLCYTRGSGRKIWLSNRHKQPCSCGVVQSVSFVSQQRQSISAFTSSIESKIRIWVMNRHERGCSCLFIQSVSFVSQQGQCVSAIIELEIVTNKDISDERTTNGPIRGPFVKSVCSQPHLSWLVPTPKSPPSTPATFPWAPTDLVHCVSP